ncbi:unnamed protein product [Heterosigma akashiwo]
MKLAAKKGAPQITLISREKYTMNMPVSLRGYVDPSSFQGQIKDLSQVFTGKYASVTTMLDEVIEIDEEAKKVILKGGGQEVPFDVCVVATGVANSWPNSFFDGTLERDIEGHVMDTMKKVSEAIKRAKSVGVIGMGPVGLELAGFIAEAKPDCTVHAFHSGEHVLNGLPVPLKEKTVAKVEAALAAAGNITTHFGSRVDLPPLLQAMREANAGGLTGAMLDRTAEGAAAFPVTPQAGGLWGLKAWAAHRAEGHPGQLRVDAHLRVEGCARVFALGDCAATGENAMAAYAKMFQAPVVAANALAVARGGADGGGPLPKAYAPRTAAFMILPVGMAAGATQTSAPLPAGVFGAKVTRTFFKSKYWK